jgi:hypothetical protein
MNYAHVEIPVVAPEKEELLIDRVLRIFPKTDGEMLSSQEKEKPSEPHGNKLCPSRSLVPGFQTKEDYHFRNLCQAH